jgi:hypothetical protein
MEEGPTSNDRALQPRALNPLELGRWAVEFDVAAPDRDPARQWLVSA